MPNAFNCTFNGCGPGGQMNLRFHFIGVIAVPAAIAELQQQFNERLVSRAEAEERFIDSDAVIACAAIDGARPKHRFQPFAIERHAILRH